MSEQFLSYIAHNIKQSSDVNNLQLEMTSRGFPCLRSSQIEENYTDPKELAKIRLESISLTQNKFFFFFLDYSEHDPVALVELGIALGCKTEHVCAIGRVRSNSFIYHPRVTYYDTVENFYHRRFLI